MKVQGRERSLELVRDLVRFYRKVVDAIEGAAWAAPMDPFAEEWRDLLGRWGAQSDARLQMLAAEAEEQERGYARS